MALDVQRIPIEIQFAQGLAGNEQKNRDKTLGLLKKFIRLRLPKLKEQLNEDEFIKLWKGMHYQLWMQDKPLIQEKLVDDICELVHDFPNESYTLMFIKAFFVTEAREWFGLDQWRMNKFMMLVREFLHNSFLFLKRYEWKGSICQELSNILEESVMNCRNIDLPIGLKLHLMDIFHVELKKVADEKLSSDTAVILLSPFLNILPTVKNENVMKKLMSFLFEAGGGLECPKEKFSQKSEDESNGLVENNTSQPKRYRLTFNKELLLKQLMEKGSSRKCPARIRSQIYKLIKRIRYLENHPQKPVKIVKERDVDLDDVEVSQREILAAVRRLKKNKQELLEKVPLRKEYKQNLLLEKKSQKASKGAEINDADTEEEEEDDGIDMEGYDDDDDNDSLDFDAEAEFFQMSTEDDLSDENSLPNDHTKDELAGNEDLEDPVVTEQEIPVTTKKNKKLGKAGSKRKNEESLDESVAQVPEKKGKKKKVDDIVTAAAVEEDEEMEVAVTEEKKSKKKKRKSKKKSGETSASPEVSATKPMFGMVDFPEEEISVAENMDETEVVEQDTQKSPEEDSKSEEKVKNKKAKKVKQNKKTKKNKISKEAPNDKSEATAELLPFPLPTDAQDTDVSNIETQNKLQLFEHLKKMKENKQSVKSKKKGKGSQVDRYFNQVQNEVDSLEMEAINTNVVEEEKDSPMDQEKVEEVNEVEAEVPVTEGEEETKTTTGEDELKISLVVKGKKGLKGKGQKVSAVENESVKPEPDLDSSAEWNQLYEHPPAFLRNAVAKAGKKSKKGKKSKNVKNEKSASPKKTTKTSVTPGGKRVSFNMEQNKALAFCVGTKLKNDGNAFHPSKKPENGILKPSPSPIRISKKFSMDKKLTMLAKSSFMAHFF